MFHIWQIRTKREKKNPQLLNVQKTRLQSQSFQRAQVYRIFKLRQRAKVEAKVAWGEPRIRRVRLVNHAPDQLRPSKGKLKKYIYRRLIENCMKIKK